MPHDDSSASAFVNTENDSFPRMNQVVARTTNYSEVSIIVVASWVVSGDNVVFLKSTWFIKATHLTLDLFQLWLPVTSSDGYHNIRYDTTLTLISLCFLRTTLAPHHRFYTNLTHLRAHFEATSFHPCLQISISSLPCSAKRFSISPNVILLAITKPRQLLSSIARSHGAAQLSFC